MKLPDAKTTPINVIASFTVMVGWLTGLIAFSSLWPVAPPIGLCEYALLGTVGTILASAIIGGGLAFGAGLLNTIVTGHFDGSLKPFAAIVFVGPVLSFYTAISLLDRLGWS